MFKTTEVAALSNCDRGLSFRTLEIYLSARRLRPHNPDQFGKFAIAETCI